MLRFACAPRADITLEQLRLALMNFVAAAKLGERFVIRIEDGDDKRNIEGKDAEIIALLELFGIRSEEVLHQSRNFKFHSAMAIDLLHRKKAFNCFCSSLELKTKEEETKMRRGLFSYDGTCERLPAEEVIDNPKPFRVRIKKPETEVTFVDEIQGELRFTPDEVDSFVILDPDKRPTHTFATAVDDMLSDISTVIESEEHLEETPRQIHVRRSLGYGKEIRYAHLPPLLYADTEIKSLLEEGFLPEAIANYLLTLGSDIREKVFTLQKAKEYFDLEHYSKTGMAKFDKNELRAFNRAHMKLLEEKELSRYVGFADVEIGKFAKLYIDEVGTTKELKERVMSLFGKKKFPTELQSTAQKVVESVARSPHFEEYTAFEAYLLDKSGLSEMEIRSIIPYFFDRQTYDRNELSKFYDALKNYIKEVIL